MAQGSTETFNMTKEGTTAHVQHTDGTAQQMAGQGGTRILRVLLVQDVPGQQLVVQPVQQHPEQHTNGTA
jgi:hypothetical protein